ncbi:MAG TPA: GAF domain-containing protein [Thermoanaerobaculia bacterium]|nr:GAF domain-containing protein [Thermoanaerobaculia bacterium]
MQDRISGLFARAWEEPGNLEAVQRRILAAAHEEFAADVCTIFLLNPITGDFTDKPKHFGQLEHSDHAEDDLPRPSGLTRHVLRHKRLLVPNLAAAPSWQRSTFSDREGITAYAAVSLKSPDRPKPFAVLYIDYRMPRSFDTAYKRQLKHFAEQASSLLQSTWLLQRYRRVMELGREINEQLDDDERLFERLARHVAGILDTSYCFLLAVYSVQSDTLDFHAMYRGKLMHAGNRPLAGGCKYVLQEKRSLLIRQYSAEAAELGVKLLDLGLGDPVEPQSLIFVPLLLRDVPLGVLSIQDLDTNAYDEEDLHTLQLLGNHVASALSNIRLFHQFEHLSRTGEILSSQRTPSDVLQAAADHIRHATGSDLVVLFPYHQDRQVFDVPPNTSPSSLRADVPPPKAAGRSEILSRTVSLAAPLFLEDARTYHEHLGFSADSPSKFQQREKVISLAVVPLRVGADVVGALYLNYRRRWTFSGPQERLIQSLAVIAASAIKNAWEFQNQDDRQRREHEILRIIDAKLNRSVSLKEVLGTIIHEANVLIEAEEGAILLPDSTDTLVSEAYLCNEPSGPGSGITRWAFDHKRPARVDNVRTDPIWRDRYYEVFAGTLSELDVPLLDGETAIGILNFESSHVGAFDEDDQRFAETLAGQVVLAISRARLYDTAERRWKERELLMQVTREIVSQLELEKPLDLLLAKTIAHTGAVAGALLQFDNHRGDLVVKAARDIHQTNRPKRVPLAGTLVGHAAQQREPLNIDPAEAPWQSLASLSSDSRSVLAVPLFARGRLWGVLDLESPQPGRFNKTAARLARAVADMAVVALDNHERFLAAQEGEDRLRALKDLSQEIIQQSAGDLDKVLQTIVQLAYDKTESAFAVLDLYHDGKPVKSHTYGAMAPAEPPSHSLMDLPGDYPTGLPRGIMKLVAETRRPYRTEGDAQADPHYRGASDLHSELCVPLKDAVDDLVGVLSVSHLAPAAFEQADQDFLSLFADQAVIAIQTKRSRETAERELARFEALADVGQELAKLTELGQREQACRIAAETASAKRGCRVVVRAYQESTGELAVMATAGTRPADKPLSVAEGISGLVFCSRETVLLEDVQHLPSGMPQPILWDPQTRSLLVSPILLGETFYGTLSLSHNLPHYFHKGDLRLAEGLTKLLAFTLNRLLSIKLQRDLEEKNKQAEALALQADALAWMAENSYSLAHRLDNELGLIIPWIGDARKAMDTKGRFDPDVDESLNHIEGKAQKVLKLSKNLKAEIRRFGYDGESFLLPTPAPFPVNALLQEIQDQFRDPESPHQLEVVHPDQAAAILAIYSYVVDILNNLVTNAREAMPEGGTITLQISGDSHHIRIDVTDSGKGIPSNLHDKIFNLFYSTKESSGFGLWSAMRKAKANGGTLTVASTPDQGATFTLTLPRADGRQEADLGNRA